MGRIQTHIRTFKAPSGRIMVDLRVDFIQC